MTRRAPSRSFASYLAFFIIFAALFVGGITVTFFVAPLFALTPLQWGLALVMTLLTGSAAAWEMRCLVVARRRAERTRSA